MLLLFNPFTLLIYFPIGILHFSLPPSVFLSIKWES